MNILIDNDYQSYYQKERKSMRGKKTKALRRAAMAKGNPSQLMVRKHMVVVEENGKREHRLKALTFLWHGFRKTYQDMKRGKDL